MQVINHFSKLYNEGTLVFVQPPCRRIVSIDYGEIGYLFDFEKKLYGKYFLSFPYVVFKIKYIKHKGLFRLNGESLEGSVKVGFMPNENSEYIYKPPLGNISEELHVCMVTNSKMFKTIKKLQEHIIATFWESEFNDNMCDTLIDYSHHPSSMYFSVNLWQKKTKENPNWYPKRFIKYQTFKSFIENPYKIY